MSDQGEQSATGSAEVSGDPVEEERWMIWRCPECGTVCEADPELGNQGVCNGSAIDVEGNEHMESVAGHHPWRRMVFIEVIPASSLDKALSRALAAEAERDTWKRAYRGASENCEAAEQRVEEAIAHFEAEAKRCEIAARRYQANSGAPDLANHSAASAYRCAVSYLRGA